MGEEAAEPIRRLVNQPEQTPALPEMLKALNHPLRRRILRALHEAGEARSPRELSRALDSPLSNVSYHVRVLRSMGAIALTDRRPVRGSSEHFYALVLPENPMVVQLLESIAQEDRAA